MAGNNHDAVYRIGVVSKLSGVSVDTIRMWERRYQAVTPERGDNNARLYSRADVDKLLAMKRLIDGGDSVGSIANLNLAQLQKRVAEITSPEIPTTVATDEPVKVITLGSLLSIKLSSSPVLVDGIEFSASFKSLYMFEQDAASHNADVVVVEYPTLGNDTMDEVNRLLSISKARFAIVCYEFGTQRALQQLNNSRCMTLRGSFSPAELSKRIHDRLRQKPRVVANAGSVELGEIVPRRYSDENLVSIASANTAVKCECPHHLTDLILKLNAFEQYSAECESRNADDAALHTYLFHTTARARAMLEEALARVVEADDIDINAA